MYYIEQYSNAKNLNAPFELTLLDGISFQQGVELVCDSRKEYFKRVYRFKYDELGKERHGLIFTVNGKLPEFTFGKFLEYIAGYGSLDTIVLSDKEIDPFTVVLKRGYRSINDVDRTDPVYSIINGAVISNHKLTKIYRTKSGEEIYCTPNYIEYSHNQFEIDDSNVVINRELYSLTDDIVLKKQFVVDSHHFLRLCESMSGLSEFSLC